MSCWHRGTLACMILGLALSAPVSGFAQRSKKYVDTFDERYPAEQAPTPSSVMRDEAPQSDPGAQRAGTPKPEEDTKVLKVTRAMRSIGPNRPRSHFVLMSRSVVDARDKVPIERKFAYAFQRMRSEWVVVRWGNGDCKVWHNDSNLPSGYGWNAVAFANTCDEAYFRMMRLYRVRKCV
jgi:hypothetical protein